MVPGGETFVFARKLAKAGFWAMQLALRFELALMLLLSQGSLTVKKVPLGGRKASVIFGARTALE